MAVFTNEAKQFVANTVVGLVEAANTYSIYIYVGHSEPWDNEVDPPVANASVQGVTYDAWHNMLFGKLVTTADYSYVTHKYVWESGTVYPYYDHERGDIANAEFFVVTSENKVYKCLDNNGGAASTEEPTTTTTAAYEQTSDGYKWKYMYTISSANNSKFTTPSYIPVTSNASVVAAATNSAIDVIMVVTGGSGYDTNNSGTVVSVSNSTVLTLESTASSDNDFYNTSAIYISTGTGAGQLREITDYIGATRAITVNTAFTTLPDGTSEYIISPKVVVTGGGTGALAYSTINATANSIDKIVVVDPGSDYPWANVTIVANSSFGSGATARAIISPRGGHGSDPVVELYASSVELAVSFANTEGNTIPSLVDYRSYGVLFNPYAANGVAYSGTTFCQAARIAMTSVIGTFQNGEQITGGTSGATGTIAQANSTVLYVTNTINGNFSAGETITGGTSFASALVNTLGGRELLPYVGLVFYVEYVEPVTRANNQTESVQVIFKA